MYQLGLVGYQIYYSLSPLIHNYWFSLYNIDGSYCLFDILPDQMQNDWNSLTNSNLHGFNITIPYKEFAFKKINQQSNRLTAINTVYRDKYGIYCSANTDLDGGLDIFKDYKRASKIVILGNGGTARALVEVFHRLQVEEIHLLQRRQKYWHPDYCLNFHDMREAGSLMHDATILINTIPDFTIPLDGLCKETLVCDYSYIKKDNKLIKQANERGCQTITGIEFLLHQAQHSFNYWFGFFPEITNELRQKLERK